VVDPSNSLVGSLADDKVGIGGATALTNGDYVVASPFWSQATGAMVGAATWADGSTGLIGAVSRPTVSSARQRQDEVGSSVTPLPNGGYTVVSREVSNIVNVVAHTGAITIAPSAGVSGVLSAANSVIGTVAGDFVDRREGISTRLTPRRALVVGRPVLNELTLLTVGTDYIPLPPARLADTRADGDTTDGLFARAVLSRLAARWRSRCRGGVG